MQCHFREGCYVRIQTCKPRRIAQVSTTFKGMDDTFHETMSDKLTHSSEQADIVHFRNGIAQLFEEWINEQFSVHTQRAYRDDILTFFRFLGRSWPDEASALLEATPTQVLAFRAALLAQNAAPKTVNRRIASLSSFYKQLARVASQRQLNMLVANPAHAQFVPRSVGAPRKETAALSAEHARLLMEYPGGESILAYRDRAIFKTYLYTGIRLATGCRLRVRDFTWKADGESTLRLRERGTSERTVGLHVAAAKSIAAYITRAGLKNGPLFRARKQSRTEELSKRAMNEATMYRTIDSYLCRLPDAMQPVAQPDGTETLECIYTPHSLRATTATLLLDAGVNITKVQLLLGHRHVATTQLYDKRRATAGSSASHDMPI